MSTVTVCNSCLRASCWQGIFMCGKSTEAGLTQRSTKQLAKLQLEHPDYWEPKP